MIHKTVHLLFLLVVFSKAWCYFILIQEQKNWSEAQSFCREHHVDLATVQSDEDRNKIQEMANSLGFTSRAWSGLYGGVSAWRWSYRDQSLVFSNWALSEDTTSRTQRMCGVIRDTGHWYTEPCDELKPFFCYQENEIGSKFTFSKSKMSWRDAQSFCRKKYIDLLTISDIDENLRMAHLLSFVFHESESWIGLSKNLWLWSDQSKVTWLSVKWSPGELDNGSGNEKCAFIQSNGRIGDENCDHLLPFFCMRRLKTQTVRLAVKSEGFLDQSAVMKAIEEKINLILTQQKMDTGSSMTWRIQADGEIFQLQENKAKNTTIPCSDSLLDNDFQHRFNN